MTDPAPGPHASRRPRRALTTLIPLPGELGLLPEDKPQPVPILRSARAQVGPFQLTMLGAALLCLIALHLNPSLPFGSPTASHPLANAPQYQRISADAQDRPDAPWAANLGGQWIVQLPQQAALSDEPDTLLDHVYTRSDGGENLIVLGPGSERWEGVFESNDIESAL